MKGRLNPSFVSAGVMIGRAICVPVVEPPVIMQMKAMHITNSAEKLFRHGIGCTHFRVIFNGREEHQGEPDHHEHDHHEHDHHEHNHYEHDRHGHGHHHHSLADIFSVVDTFPVSQKTGSKIKKVYEKIALAEAEVHGREMSNIHFHELGTMDALADITAVCLMMEKLSPERVIFSPVCTGYGTVSCAHGILPVPVPATALLLRGIPVFPGEIPCVMCIPTGAALRCPRLIGFSICQKTVNCSRRRTTRRRLCRRRSGPARVRSI